MEINNCPECAAETVSVGFALWAEGDAPVMVIECVEPDCAWATIHDELFERGSLFRGDDVLAA